MTKAAVAVVVVLRSPAGIILRREEDVHSSDVAIVFNDRGETDCRASGGGMRRRRNS